MSEELSSLMAFLPQLHAKRVLQVGLNSGLSKLLVNNGISHLTILTSKDAATSNEKIDATAGKIKYLSGEKSERKFNLNEKFDFVFLTEDLSGLSDDELLVVMETSLEHMQVANGYLFFTGSCSQGQFKRSPINYVDLSQMKVVKDGEAQYGFELVFAKPNASNPFTQAFFLFNKVKLENHHGFKTLQEFMDHKQYTRNGIKRYERIFGDGFISTGGIHTTTKFLQELNLKPGMRVLDVGCGIGGGDFLMAQKYDVDVFGIDLSSNVVAIAWERAINYSNLSGKVKFEIGDITKQKYPDNYFDLIYSRDTILHIKNKQGLFSQFKSWLKPGGKIFITDYCCGKRPWSEEFELYVQQRGYDLRTVHEYGSIFSSLGFKNVEAKNITDEFVNCLNSELVKMEQIREEFVRDFSLEDFNYLVDGWKAKLVRCAAGHQIWGCFQCEK